MLLLAASLAVVQVACDRSADGGLITPLTRATGALVVRVQPGGNSIDPDGFSVTLDGQTRPVAFDAPARFDTLVAGQHVARLTDLAAHCSASPDSVTATIRAGVTDTVAVTVFCIGGVAFNSDGSGSSEIDYLREDGRTIRLTSGPGLKSIGAWSPDGSRLLFTNSDYARFNSDLFSVRSDGTDLKQLTSGTGSEYAASWSPDGTRIAFTQYVEGVHDDEPWIVVMDADGTNQRTLLDLSWNAFRPVWAPDGSELYFTCYRAGIAFAICASAPDGTGLRTIRFDALSPRFPVPVQASPDGRAISFSDLNMTWVGMLDGSSAIPLTPGDDSFAAKWAPTSDRLLLSVVDETSKFGLATVNRDGTGYRLLTGFTTDPAGDWSPDGSLIAFSAARAGSTQIMVMNADGTGVRPLTGGALIKHTPVWNPKSRPVGPLFVRIGK
jgi:Tol biopolymer transport system component